MHLVWTSGTASRTPLFRSGLSGALRADLTLEAQAPPLTGQDTSASVPVQAWGPPGSLAGQGSHSCRLAKGASGPRAAQCGAALRAPSRGCEILLCPCGSDAALSSASGGSVAVLRTAVQERKASSSRASEPPFGATCCRVHVRTLGVPDLPEGRSCLQV